MHDVGDEAGPQLLQPLLVVAIGRELRQGAILRLVVRLQLRDVVAAPGEIERLLVGARRRHPERRGDHADADSRQRLERRPARQAMMDLFQTFQWVLHGIRRPFGRSLLGWLVEQPTKL
jgi:hypothetical protein